jgi:hypothetical protein
MVSRPPNLDTPWLKPKLCRAYGALHSLVSHPGLSAWANSFAPTAGFPQLLVFFATAENRALIQTLLSPNLKI